MDEHEALLEQIAALKAQNRELDDNISRLTAQRPFDQIQLQRLKREKLALKDRIWHLEASTVPDIIA